MEEKITHHIRITRCERIHQHEVDPKMIVGFTIQNADLTNSVYLETVLNNSEINGKDDSECVILAMNKIKDKIEAACDKVIKQTNFLLGSYYEPE